MGQDGTGSTDDQWRPVPLIAQLPVRAGDDVGEKGITVPGGWSGPEVAKTPAVVAMVGIDAFPRRNDAPLDYADECTAWDSGYQC